MPYSLQKEQFAEVLTDGKELECNVIMTHGRIMPGMPHHRSLVASQPQATMCDIVWSCPTPQTTSSPNLGKR